MERDGCSADSQLCSILYRKTRIDSARMEQAAPLGCKQMELLVVLCFYNTALFFFHLLCFFLVSFGEGGDRFRRSDAVEYNTSPYIGLFVQVLVVYDEMRRWGRRSTSGI